MKKHYRRVASRRSPEPGAFYYRTYHYYRPVRTVPEIRAYYSLRADRRSDDDMFELNIFPRRCAHELNPWNDFAISRSWKKSWKDFTKFRKQWMMADGPPIDPNDRW